jgi:RNA polymerase sigma factor (sigma-70 family)
MTTDRPIAAASLAQETAWVHRLARQLVRDEHLAADVAQDTLAVGLGGAAPADEKVAPRGWLAGIARVLAAQAVRRRREREVRELLAARSLVGDPEARAAERLRVHELLARAVRELPEPYRTAVTLRFFEGRSAAAIARQRGHTPDQVRQHVHRGLGMLRRTLDAELGDRRAWLVLFGELGLVRPSPWAPVPFVALAVALLAVAVVVAAAWRARSADATNAPDAPSAADSDAAGWSTAPLPVQDRAKVAAAVDAYLTPLVRMGAFSGTVLLARGGAEPVTWSGGMADVAAGKPNALDTRFKLMSTTKAITAVAVMRLVQAGVLKLDDRVGAHVQPWPAQWNDVTVHDLLDHCSGIANLENEWAMLARETGRRGRELWPAMAAKLAAEPRARAAAASSYSNFNFELLGVVAEMVSGKPFAQLLTDEVLTPAGMRATGLDDGRLRPDLAVGYFLGEIRDELVPSASEQDMSVIQAAGGLWSSVHDLYALDRALRGESVLTTATQASMTTPRKRSPRYACGWQVAPLHGRRCASHGGGANGFVAEWLRFPDDDACVVVLSNLAYAPLTRIANDLAAILLGRDQPVPVVLTPEQLDTSTGTFVSPGQPQRRLLVRRIGSLLLGFDVWPDVASCRGCVLVPAAPGRLLSPWDNGEYRIDAQHARTPWDTLDRCDAGVAHWNEVLGPWTAQGAFGGACELGYATMSDTHSRLVLNTPTTWPKQTRICPLGPDVALALASVDFGTLLRREGAALHWTRRDGQIALLTRPTWK